jgi:hypothetical protein
MVLSTDFGGNGMDKLIRQSLRRFLRHVQETNWSGRENEAVNLYALGFLLGGELAGVKLDPTQIGIEVAVAVALKKGKKAQVRKDLVIWPEAGMNRWHPGNSPQNKPLAILEWKVQRSDTAKPRGTKYDLDWLKDYSTTADARPDFIGYSIFLDLRSSPAIIAAKRVSMGESAPFPIENSNDKD